MFDILKVIAVFAICIVALFALMAWASSAECTNHWARSGLRSDFGVIQGCMVERKDGTWVPEKAIRDVSL